MSIITKDKDYSYMFEYQERLLNLLKFTDCICRKNNIKYTLIDGTLLGAIRHKGMIPWDADIDIAFTPIEFDKFCKIFDQIKGRYYLNHLPNHTFKKQKHAFADIRAGRIVDKKCSNGYFGIDIFCIDFLGDNLAYAEETIKIYKRYSKLCRFTSAFHVPVLFIDGKINMSGVFVRMLWPILFIISKLFTPLFEYSYLNFRKNRINCNKEDCKYYTIEPFFGRVGVLDNNLLKDGYIDVPFEDMKAMIAKNYDSYLIPTYGDYMQLPPVDKRVPYPSKEFILRCKWKDD